MFGRKPAKTHREMMMDELAESYEHFRQAASHMAGGAAERLAPRYEKARGAASQRMAAARGAVNPLMQQMREGAASARMTIDLRPQKQNKKRKRWPSLVGLLAAGTAVGATGAMIMRRRRAAAEWEEQEAIPPIEYGQRSGPEAQKAAEKVAAGSASMAESAAEKAGKMAESARGRQGGSSTPSSSGSTGRSGSTSTSSTRSPGDTSKSSGPVGATEPPGTVGGSPLHDLADKETGSATGSPNPGVRSGSPGPSSGKAS